MPWAAARDEHLKLALWRDKKAREPMSAETEQVVGELDRLR